MARENVKRTALCASMVLAGCALVAVMFMSNDAPAALIHEEADTVVVPEAEFLTKAEKTPVKASKAHPKVVLPADHDLGVWGKYTDAKAKAKKSLSGEDFAGLEDQCMAARTESARQCGTLYCAAHTTCGKPCPKLYAQPPIQVVPLQPGGPQFHKVAEVDIKEKRNKELKQKEVGAKERATKEHAEKAKEKAGKEVQFKERIGKERDTKEVHMKKEEAKENDMKEQIRVELQGKEEVVKEKVNAMKDSSEEVCESQMETFAVGCEEQKVKARKAESEIKEAAVKAQEKAAYGSGYTSGSYASGRVPPAAEAYVSGIAEDEAMEEEHDERSTKFATGEGIPATDAVAAWAPNATYSSTAQEEQKPPSSFGETASICETYTAETCITTLGCHLQGNACVEGEGEAVKPEAAAVVKPELNPFTIANTCKDNEEWTNEGGDSCVDLVDSTMCDDETYSGDSTGLSSNQACCMCKIEATKAQGCTENPTWTSNGETCASVATKADSFCSKHGSDITPGSGCNIDGSNCISANEACCACKNIAADATADTADDTTADAAAADATVDSTADATEAPPSCMDSCNALVDSCNDSNKGDAYCSAMMKSQTTFVAPFPQLAGAPNYDCDVACTGESDAGDATADDAGDSTADDADGADGADEASDDEQCPRENGFCVKANGADQNSGVIKLDSLGTYGTEDAARANCLQRCRDHDGATGCEVIWNQGNKGCYVQTQAIDRGNNVGNHYCWVFSKCGAAGTGRRLLQSDDAVTPIADDQADATADGDDQADTAETDAAETDTAETDTADATTGEDGVATEAQTEDPTEQDDQGDQSSPEGGDTVGGDVVPSETEINAEIEAIVQKTEAAQAAQAATKKAMVVDAAKVESAATAATAAGLATGSAKSLQERDVMAQKFYQEEFIDSLDNEIKEQAGYIKNMTAQSDKILDMKNQTCERQAESNRSKCLIGDIKKLKKYEEKLMADAKKKNKEFGSKAATAAADWGKKLKMQTKAEKHLSDVEDAAEADLKTHVEAQPGFLLEMGEDDDHKCKEAKNSAYSQCRDGLNAVYLKCATIFEGAMPATPKAEGSGMVPSMASAVGSAAGSGMMADPMLEQASIYRMQDSTEQVFGKQVSSKSVAVPTSATTDFDNAFAALVNPHGLPDDEPKKVETMQDDSSKALNTVDDLFKEMGDNGHSASSDEEDMDDDYYLFQEAGAALKEMGFPPLWK